MKSFLQMQEWLEFQKEVGHKTWRFSDGKITVNIIKLGLPLGKSMLYIPHGPVVDFSNAQSAKPEAIEKFTTGHGPEMQFESITSGIKNELASFIKYLKNLARKENAIFIKIEPLSDVVMELLYRKGIKKSSKQIQPNKTVVIDLDLPEALLLERMHPKTRYNIKVAEKHNIIVKKDYNSEIFWELLQKTTKRDKFSSHPKEYYDKLLKLEGNLKTELFFAYLNGKPVAVAIILRYGLLGQGDTGYYLHGALDYEYRAIMAPYALHWDIIKYLKNNGIKYYDFWGIDAKKWPGVTRFKLGWGGRQIEYPGSFDLPISKIWYFGYNLARKIL